MGPPVSSAGVPHSRDLTKGCPLATVTKGHRRQGWHPLVCPGVEGALRSRGYGIAKDLAKEDCNGFSGRPA